MSRMKQESTLFGCRSLTQLETSSNCISEKRKTDREEAISFTISCKRFRGKKEERKREALPASKQSSC